MTKAVLFSSNLGDIKADMAFVNNLGATTDPTVTDDISLGYTVGSIWVNTTANRAFVCVDSTDGAAVWNEAASGGAGQNLAPDASTPTGTGGAALSEGGSGGTTSGVGGTASNRGGAGVAGNSAGGAADTTGGAGQGSAAGGVGRVAGGVGGATGAGGAAQVAGGAGGATSGAGGAASVTGGAGTAGNANGGSAVVQGGAPHGTGVKGSSRVLGLLLVAQGAPATQDTAVTLTAAQLLSGIIHSTPGGAINLTLPLQADVDTAIPDAAAGDAFDFSIINTSGGANTVTVVANSWTTVGVLTVAQNVSGRFRARKTGAGAWTLYRLS